MKNLYTVLFIFLIGCSGSKEFDNEPIPVGGENRVRSILLKEFGSDYYNLSGYKLSLYIYVDENGIVKNVSSMIKPTDWMESYDWTAFHNKIKNTFIRQIQFTPAKKDGKAVPANFRYYFTF